MKSWLGIFVAFVAVATIIRFLSGLVAGQDARILENAAREEQKNILETTSNDIQNSFPELDPVQVFEEWKSYHSSEVLATEESLEHRKFIVADFGCPLQLGMQSMNFVEALLVAIASNRTLLFKYGGFRGWVSKGMNSKENCTKLLTPASWMPLYEDVNRRMNLKIQKAVRLFGNGTTDEEGRNWKQRHDAGLPVQEDSSAIVTLHSPTVRGISRFPGTWLGLLDLRNRYASAYLSQMFNITPPIREEDRIQKLYKEGVYFLYGMLFWRSFAFTQELADTVKEYIVPSDSTTFSIAVHSRHPSVGDDGTDVAAEINCIKNMLHSRFRREQQPCRTYLMSDRQATIRAIAERVKNETNCSIVYVKEYNGFSSGHGNREHGQFAGAGFLQDLMVVGQARSGMVHRQRSSTTFVASYIEYHRRIADWREFGVRETDRMVECTKKGIQKPIPVSKLHSK